MRAYAIALQLMIRKEPSADNDDDNDSVIDVKVDNDKDDNSDDDDDNNNKEVENSNRYGRHKDDDSENWSDDSSSVNSVSNLNPALGLGASTLQKKRFNIDEHDHNIDIKTRLIGIGLGNDDNLTASVHYWVEKLKESKIYTTTKPYADATDITEATKASTDNMTENSSADVPRWNYFIQRSYLNYIKTWPLYGVHLAKGFLVKGGDKDVEVLIGLSGRGLYILDPITWCLIFKCPYYHISRCNLIPDNIDVMLSLTVNGMTIDLKSYDSTNLHRMLTDYIVEILGRGGFLYGSEGGDNLLSLTNVIPKHDSTEIFKHFLKDFTVLPSPPSPVALTLNDDYFEAPKDNDENTAIIKMQEEIKEKEQLRFILASQGEKQKELLQQGKKLSHQDRKMQRKTQRKTNRQQTHNLNQDFTNSNEPHRKIEASILGIAFHQSYTMLAANIDTNYPTPSQSTSFFAEIPKKYLKPKK